MLRHLRRHRRQESPAPAKKTAPADDRTGRPRGATPDAAAATPAQQLNTCGSSGATAPRLPPPAPCLHRFNKKRSHRSGAKKKAPPVHGQRDPKGEYQLYTFELLKKRARSATSPTPPASGRQRAAADDF